MLAQEPGQALLLGGLRPVRQGPQVLDSALGGVKLVDGLGETCVLLLGRGDALRLGVAAHAGGVGRLRSVVDLGAERREAGVLLRDDHRQLADLLSQPGLGLARQQPHRLAQQVEAGRAAPGRIRHDGLQDAVGPRQLIFDLERTAVAQGLMEDPAVVEAHQEALEQDLLQPLEIGGVAGVGFALQVAQHVGDLVVALAQRDGVVVPLAVLDPPAALPARVRLGRVHRAVGAEPADPGEGTLGRGLHGLDPLAPHLGRGKLRGCRHGGREEEQGDAGQ
jgi:hypothetical protein